MDIAFEEYVEHRLMMVSQELGMSLPAIKNLAIKMARNEFRAIKMEFGTRIMFRKNIRITVPGISGSFTAEYANIFRGMLSIPV
jgi:hypothetical protein